MGDRTGDKVDFGYREVHAVEKARLVGRVFDSVAGRYDLMNDLMSAGLHRLWKRYFMKIVDIRQGMRVLDLASGTGDIASLAARELGDDGLVVASDINAAMLSRGRERLTDSGRFELTRFVLADAESLPFPDRSFDRVTMAFGLRNVTHKERALANMQRVLRPGGSAHVLEFSTLRAAALRPAYDFYSFQVLPRLGNLVARDAGSYRYLAESIRRHPDQETLQSMMEQAGLERVSWRNLAGGIVAVHSGWRI